MGNCNSCESTNVAMVKVILQDGKLQEFAYPVKVSQVLEKNPRSFLCNMDDMDFDSFISAIHNDEDLQPGRLYFALPMSWLRSPLRGEKMASLAVKASLALKHTSSGGGLCGCGQKSSHIDPLTCTNYSMVLGSTSPKVVVGGGRGGHVRRDGGQVSMQRRQGGRGGGRGRRDRMAAKLSVIVEEHHQE